MRLFNNNREKDKSCVKGQEAVLAGYCFIAVRVAVQQQFTHIRSFFKRKGTQSQRGGAQSLEEFNSLRTCEILYSVVFKKILNICCQNS